MADEKKKRTSISIRPTHGTARLVQIPSVLPQEKSEKEVFWVDALMGKLSDQSSVSYKVLPNEDDSHGNHDVIVEKQNDCPIGVQVTELTSELRRKREAIRESYIKKVLKALEKKKVSSKEKVLAKLLCNSPNPEGLNLNKPELIVRAIKNDDLINLPKIIDGGRYKILLDKVGDNDFYIPNKNNIGIDVDFDQVPRCVDTYQKAIDYLVEKKSKSKSPWLLMWSLDFWKDKHTFGEVLIEYMKTAFETSNFEKVFFLESLDGKGYFEANLKLHIIKD